MTNQLAIIEQKLNSSDVSNRLALALNLNPKDEEGQAKAFKYASSVLAEIKKSAGSKNDLTTCNPDSIVQAMIDAAQFQIAIDGRQHAHLIKRGTSATLMIGFRGYIAKISEYYQNADFTAEVIFKGDKLTVKDEGGLQSYSLEKANPLNDNWDEVTGALVCMAYSKGTTLFRKVTTVSKNDLIKMRKAATQDFIWSAWPIEKAKAAAIKRACKIQFADIQGLQEMIRYDNENNFDLSQQPAAPVRKSIVDNINESIALPPLSEEEPIVPKTDVMDAHFEDQDDDLEKLLNIAAVEAEKGVKEYTEWLHGLNGSQKEDFRPHNKKYSQIAKTADLDMAELPPI